MNFGLLCDDAAAEPIVAALKDHPRHTLTRAVLVSPAADQLLLGHTGVVCGRQWEELLAAKDVDAVIIGGGSADAWDGARQLAGDGVPLLVVPQIAGDASMLYELSLIREDRQGVLFPAWIHRYDAAVMQLLERLRRDDRPTLTYARWQREVPVAPETEMPQKLIDSEAFRDVDLWRMMFPTTDQVTALRTGGTKTGALIQSLAMSGRDIPEVSWVIQAGPATVSQLTIQTARGGWVLSRADAGWWLTGDFPAVQGNDRESAARLLDAFADAVARKSDAGAWREVLHAAEIVEAAGRSLTRRRTIELHHEPLSERAIFKSQMAALGCGVLMLTLLLTLMFLGVAIVVPLDGKVLQAGRVLIFMPLFLFLFLQLLFPLTRAPHKNEEAQG